MAKKQNFAIKYIDLSKEYFNSVFALSEERLGHNYITKENLSNFIKDKNNVCHLIVDEYNQLLGFMLAHVSTVHLLAKEFHLDIDEIKKIIGNNEKVYIIEAIVLQKNAEKYGLATELLKKSLEQAKKAKFHSAWTALWIRKDGTIPAQKLANRLGFSYYKTVRTRLFDRIGYECMDCKGRCTCNDAIHYKIL